MEAFRAGTLDRQGTLELASACLSLGISQNKTEIANKIVVLYPDDEEMLRMAILLFENASQAEKALPLYEKLRKRHPEDTKLTLDAARSYSWAGRVAESLNLFDMLISSGNGNDLIMSQYADVLYENKQYAKAVIPYRKLWKTGALQKKQAINFVHALMAAGEQAESAKQLNSLAKLYPGDTDVLQATADISFAMKEYGRAATLYRELIVKKPADLAVTDWIADVAMARKDYPEAIKINKEILGLSAENQKAMLTIARASSWQGDYYTALAYYDKLIASGNPEPLYFREKARVLGWMGNQSGSVSLYEAALHAYPRNNALKAEAEAKKYYYSNTYRPAVKAYKAWLVAEPKQPEALFDLGQFYIQNSRWEEAIKTYDELLSEIADHRPATLARQKAKVTSSMININSGAEYFSAHSSRGQTYKGKTDVSFTGFYTSISYPFQDRLTGFMNLNSKFYRFEDDLQTTEVIDPKTPQSKGITLGLEYRNLPDILVRGACGFRQNPNYLKESRTGFLETESQPLDNLHLALSFHKEDVISNYTTLKNHLQTNHWQGRLVYDGYRRWHAGIDYAIDHYSDSNSSVTTGLYITANLLYDPQRLSVTYRLQEYGFGADRLHDADYWTPSTFTTHTAGIEWQHYLNKERFQGANAAYYKAAFRLSLEPEGNVSHQIHAGLHRDWSNRFSTSVEVQYTWDTRSSIYQDKLLKGGLQWFF
ncbi:MAG: tetratricopeptide repeat protein [Chlorobium sp.]